MFGQSLHLLGAILCLREHRMKALARACVSRGKKLFSCSTKLSEHEILMADKNLNAKN